MCDRWIWPLPIQYWRTRVSTNQPYLVRDVFTPEQKLAYKQKTKSHRVVDPQTSYVMVDMLRGVIEQGTGRGVRSAGFRRPCAGKTGTTNDYRDAWFIGFTPRLVCAVWVGYDDNRPMKTKWNSGVTGAVAALPVWTRFMKQAMQNEPYTDFPIPPGIQFKKVDATTGEPVTPEQSGMPVAVRIKKNL
ncbi:MAG: penicillin-binding transpeptidase domain-containing protein [candidate division KSB1 bacterium]|nr:penicillin-binding transpeptidase domain-containing protein [candidate division KSB1 bacterium]